MLDFNFSLNNMSTFLNKTNSTNATDEIHYGVEYTNVEKVVIIIFLTAMSIFSIFGNTLVFVAYFKIESLQRATNYFILSLATADFIVALFVVNIHTMYMVLQWPYELMNYQVCLLWLTVDYWVFQVSVFGVMLIAGDRYFSIKFPHNYRTRRTDNVVKIAIFITWLVAFLIWVPLILGFAYDEGVEADMIRKKQCDVGSAKIIPATVIGCCVSYLVPVAIVTFFAIDSMHILLKMKSTLSKVKKPSGSPQSPIFKNPYDQKASSTLEVNDDQTIKENTNRGSNLSINDHDNNNIYSPDPILVGLRTKDIDLGLSSNSLSSNMGSPKSDTFERKKKAKEEYKTKTTSRVRFNSTKLRLSDYQWIATFNVLLATSFLINILPFGVLAVTRSVCLHVTSESCVNQEWWYFGYIMCYLNSMLNPLCYAFGNKNFKRAFKQLLCRRENRRDSVPTLTITEDSVFQNGSIESNLNMEGKSTAQRLK